LNQQQPNKGESEMAKSVKKVPAKVANGDDTHPVAKAKVISNGKVINVLVQDNPKRGLSRERFALYRNGLSVEQYVARSVKAGNSARVARADLKWDTERKFIAIQ
jgi:hypothetical protein